MRAYVFWWPGVRGPDRTRGNTIALSQIGVEAQEVLNNYQAHKDFGADFIFTGMPSMVAKLQPKLPTILQLGGYDLSVAMPGGEFVEPVISRMEKHAELLSVIDPTYFKEMWDSDVDFDFERYILAPNGYTRVQTQVKPTETDSFNVLNPMGDFFAKEPERFVEAARRCEYDDIRFGLSTRSAPSYSVPPDWLSIDNLKVFPQMPHNQWLSVFKGADVIAPWSKAEILPWSVFESFAFGKPTIVDKIGAIQSLPEEVLPEAVDDFGKPVEHFDIKWEDEYYEGDHYLYAGDVDEFLEKVYELYENRDKLESLGRKAQSWTQDYWTQTEKMRTLVEMMTGGQS